MTIPSQARLRTLEEERQAAEATSRSAREAAAAQQAKISEYQARQAELQAQRDELLIKIRNAQSLSERHKLQDKRDDLDRAIVATGLIIQGIKADPNYGSKSSEQKQIIRSKNPGISTKETAQIQDPAGVRQKERERDALVAQGYSREDADKLSYGQRQSLLYGDNRGVTTRNATAEIKYSSSDSLTGGGRTTVDGRAPPEPLGLRPGVYGGTSGSLIVTQGKRSQTAGELLPKLQAKDAVYEYAPYTYDKKGNARFRSNAPLASGETNEGYVERVKQQNEQINKAKNNTLSPNGQLGKDSESDVLVGNSSSVGVRSNLSQSNINSTSGGSDSLDSSSNRPESLGELFSTEGAKEYGRQVYKFTSERLVAPLVRGTSKIVLANIESQPIVVGTKLGQRISGDELSSRAVSDVKQELVQRNVYAPREKLLYDSDVQITAFTAASGPAISVLPTAARRIGATVLAGYGGAKVYRNPTIAQAAESTFDVLPLAAEGLAASVATGELVVPQASGAASQFKLFGLKGPRGSGAVVLSKGPEGYGLGRPNIVESLRRLPESSGAAANSGAVEIRVSGPLETATLQRGITGLAASERTERAVEFIPTAQRLVGKTKGIDSKYLRELPTETERLGPEGVKVVLEVARENKGLVSGSFSRGAQLAPDYDIAGQRLALNKKPGDIDVHLETSAENIQFVAADTAKRLRARGIDARVKNDQVKNAVEVKQSSGEYAKAIEFLNDQELASLSGEVAITDSVVGFQKSGKPLDIDGVKATRLNEELRGTVQGVARVRRTGSQVDIFPPEKRVKDIASVSVSARTLYQSQRIKNPLLLRDIERFESLYPPELVRAQVKAPLADFRLSPSTQRSGGAGSASFIPATGSSEALLSPVAQRSTPADTSSPLTGSSQLRSSSPMSSRGRGSLSASPSRSASPSALASSFSPSVSPSRSSSGSPSRSPSRSGFGSGSPSSSPSRSGSSLGSPSRSPSSSSSSSSSSRSSFFVPPSQNSSVPLAYRTVRTNQEEFFNRRQQEDPRKRVAPPPASKVKYGYSPSFTALGLGITGTPTKKSGGSGIAVRPIVSKAGRSVTRKRFGSILGTESGSLAGAAGLRKASKPVLSRRDDEGLVTKRPKGLGRSVFR